MSILPNAILALKSGAGKPPAAALGRAVMPVPGAAGSDTKPLPSAVLKAKKPAAGAGVEKPEPPPRRATATKREIARAEERAAVSARIRDVLDNKPSRAKIAKYMLERVSELTLASDI